MSSPSPARVCRVCGAGGEGEGVVEGIACRAYRRAKGVDEPGVWGRNCGVMGEAREKGAAKAARTDEGVREGPRGAEMPKAYFHN